MQRVKVTIQGTTPLICSKFTDKQGLKISSRSSLSGGAADNGSEYEQAKAQLYLDADGNPVMPSTNLLRAIVEAGRYVKIGKRTLTTAKSTQIYGSLFIPELELPIISKAGWSVDSRSVVVPATGGRIMAHRPIFFDWSLNFHLEIDDTVFNSKLIRELVDIAGQRIGLGAFRPDRKGPFGCFKVVQWIEEDTTKSTV